ncbi:MAG: hypothetical protein KDE47_29710, partial [Caldilineaceae bacterium]|nr:hypothetical protein [Caldilineaceae bacterium]
VSEQVGLVFGGATKIKAYVFESAKLPELRGGSVLLDRLNLDYSRKLFADAPECIIYAAGGDLLALAPAAVAAEKAAALEAAYTRTTLTAQAVAASTRLSLLELQYGRTPQAYWADDYQQECDSGAPAKVALLRSYYGDPTHKQEPAWTDTMLFHLRKCFGEVVGTVALQRLRRREGNPPLQASDAEDNTQTVADGDAGLRALPHFETLPHGQFCTSCDRRMAIARIPDLEDDLCEPCLRKRWIGWRTRYGNVRPYGIPDLVRTIERTESVMKAATDWRPEEFEREVGIDAYKAWYHAFQDYLDQALGDEELRSDVPADLAALRTAYLANVRGVSWESRTPVDGPSTDYPGIWPAYTFTEIGQAATPAGYIGL